MERQLRTHARRPARVAEDQHGPASFKITFEVSSEDDAHRLTQSFQAACDLLTDAAYLLQGLSDGVGHRPVHVSAPGVDRAGVSASHRDHEVRACTTSSVRGLGNSATTGTPISSRISTTSGSICPEGREAAVRTCAWSPAICRNKPRPSETVRHSARTRAGPRAFLASHGRWPLPVRLACLRQIVWLVMADVGKLGHVLLVAGSCQPRTARRFPWRTLS